MGFCLEVSGDFACFTRPEMRVERVSYDIMTPSAARNIYQSIFWKPQIAWHIDRIEVINPIRWMTISRNEVGATVSQTKVRQTMRRGEGRLQMFVEDQRVQRSSLILRDVCYRIYAHFSFTNQTAKNESVEKYLGMFLRRARKGQCFRQPYLGCKEFAADFQLVEPDDEVMSPVNESQDFGWMLYDFNYADNPPSPRFFNACMQSGVVHIPSADDIGIRG